MNARRLLIAYVLVNALLYSVLLPLWEGFDEPFHFGYVQQLANGQGLPDPNTARLSNEVATSILLAPGSYVVKKNLPQVTSYSQYFSWPALERAEVRRRLNEIPPEFRWQPSQFVNYEAQHPPLAYFLLAIPERLLANAPLPIRITILRIVAALIGSLLLLRGAEKLFAQIGIGDPYRAVALFCLFSCQMTWATMAHVGNDWLSIPVATWLLVALNSYDAHPSLRRAALAAALLAAGLLTKAYFLAFVPLFIGLAVRRPLWKNLAVASIILLGLAGPWYGRNLMRYGTVSGMQESRAGVDLHAVLLAAPKVNWLTTTWSAIHYSLWTGNNTFLTFSTNALNLIIGTGLVGFLLWASSRHGRAEWITFVYSSLFVLALGYDATTTYIYSHGVHAGPEPWYTQVLSAPLLGLTLLGASRGQRLGRYVAAFLVVLFGYVLAATYAAKLIPLYGGYEGRTSLAATARLYVHGLKVLITNLNSIVLVPAAVVCLLAGITIVLAGAQQVVIIRYLFARTQRRSGSCLSELQ